MKKSIAVISTIVLATVVLGGCGNKIEEGTTKESTQNTASSSSSTTETEAEAGKTTLIKTDNGDFELSLLDGWKEIDPEEVNDYADLAIENTKRDMYLMVLSEPEEYYEDFDEFLSVAAVTELVDTVTEESSLEAIEEDGWTGQREIFSGEVDGLEVFYIYDLLASENGHFVQRVAWTSAVWRENNEEEMKEVLASVVDVSEPDKE